MLMYRGSLTYCIVLTLNLTINCFGNQILDLQLPVQRAHRNRHSLLLHYSQQKNIVKRFLSFRKTVYCTNNIQTPCKIYL